MLHNQSLPGKIIVGILVLFQFVFVDSCAGSPRVEKKGGLSPQHDFALEVIEREEKLDSNLKFGNNVPFVELKFSLLSLTGGRAEKFFNDTLYNGKSTKQYIEDTVKIWTDEYNAHWNDPAAQDAVWASLCGEYYETHTHSLYPDILVVKRTKYSYTGGAHGNENDEYVILDLKELKRLSLNDLIAAGKKDGLLPLLKKALSSLDNGKDVQMDDVFVSENIFYDPQGIGFYWNEYEIASYAAGRFEVILPYTEISGMLTDKGRSLFGK
ncbi:MAG: RsiV family protein [Treponema sp.]|nr:RsiV family protein [Treponema sp.]